MERFRQKRLDVRENEITAAQPGYVVQVRQRHELRASDLGSSLPCWIVDRISTSSIHQCRHGNFGHHVTKTLAG